MLKQHGWIWGLTPGCSGASESQTDAPGSLYELRSPMVWSELWNWRDKNLWEKSSDPVSVVGTIETFSPLWLYSSIRVEHLTSLGIFGWVVTHWPTVFVTSLLRCHSSTFSFWILSPALSSSYRITGLIKYLSLWQTLCTARRTMLVPQRFSGAVTETVLQVPVVLNVQRRIISTLQEDCAGQCIAGSQPARCSRFRC